MINGFKWESTLYSQIIAIIQAIGHWHYPLLCGDMYVPVNGSFFASGMMKFENYPGI